jgi:protein-tyrosine-phosphatase
MSAPHPTRITFVDTGNTGRSVAAEALAAVTIDKGHLDAQVISRAWCSVGTDGLSTQGTL